MNYQKLFELTPFSRGQQVSRVVTYKDLQDAVMAISEEAKKDSFYDIIFKTPSAVKSGMGLKNVVFSSDAAFQVSLARFKGQHITMLLTRDEISEIFKSYVTPLFKLCADLEGKLGIKADTRTIVGFSPKIMKTIYKSGSFPYLGDCGVRTEFHSIDNEAGYKGMAVMITVSLGIVTKPKSVTDPVYIDKLRVKFDIL